MKKKHLLVAVVLIFSVSIGGYFLHARRLRDSLSGEAYVGYCSRCKCLCKVQAYQVSIIRQGGSPSCLICPKCKKAHESVSNK